MHNTSNRLHRQDGGETPLTNVIRSKQPTSRPATISSAPIEAADRRRRSSGTNGGVSTGKLKIQLNDHKKRSVDDAHTKYRRTYVFSPIPSVSAFAAGYSDKLAEQLLADFKFNMELALRTAVGVVLASLVLTKNTDSTALMTATSRTKQWYFFPEWYILGGLSYVATATVFGCGKNIGSTIRELFQQISGVGLALLYNLLIFSYFEPQVFNTKAERKYTTTVLAKVDGTLTRITNSFSGTPYYVHEGDFFTILPFIMLFTIVALVLPLETNTKKYMLGNNLYFALTLVSPNDFTNPSVLKAPGDDLYRTSNLLRNLMVYMMLGVTGACIAQVMLWFPYPIFAIRKLQEHTTECASMLEELLNLLVDSYCFKHKDVEHMNFLKLKLKRKFDVAEAKLATMHTLLNDIWWEQLVGLHLPLRFRKPATKPFIDLFGTQLQNLRAMNQAILWERYDGGGCTMN
ncbi:hypothetical protein DYB30_005585 [Aphanomyces astaci]|uniref:Uncharacterized protein n=5 Tax=Aphanomyces astaci TaxID=112090 RepID=A0A397DNT8_APHAT|nr:hypothetical protein DYB38_010285 [Aphanomyces astaci]RHY65481.1 hypothetical protein DYB30_005585 [Aphanomyces astaci]